MADVSKILASDGNFYDIKDASARFELGNKLNISSESWRPIACNNSQYAGYPVRQYNDSDLFTLEEGTNIKLTPTTGKITIAATDTKPSNFVAPSLPSLVGTDYENTGWVSGGVAVNHATNKSVGSIQFPKGIWLIKLSVGFYANGTGMRAIGFSMTKNENNYTVILPPHTQSGNQTKLADFFIVNANEGDRYYIQAYQTNSVSGAMYVYPTYSAIKLM